jgi:hypothetical protein
MDNLVHKFQEARSGRWDTLGDKTERVVFTFGAPVAMTPEEAEKVMHRQDKFNSCLEHKNFQFLDDVLKNGPSIRRKLRDPHKPRVPLGSYLFCERVPVEPYVQESKSGTAWMHEFLQRAISEDVKLIDTYSQAEEGSECNEVDSP